MVYLYSVCDVLYIITQKKHMAYGILELSEVYGCLIYIYIYILCVCVG